MQCFQVYKDSIQTWQRSPKNTCSFSSSKYFHCCFWQYGSTTISCWDTNLMPTFWLILHFPKKSSSTLPDKKEIPIFCKSIVGRLCNCKKIPQNPFRFTDSINARWEELFSATKSVHCTRCTLCIATPTDICVIDCAISSYISWSRQYIYEYIFSVYGSSSEFTSAHSTQSKGIDFCPSSY